VIDRRALVNFRIAPEPLTSILPPRMRPQLVSGWAIGGICLIRLRDIRPAGLPAFVGLRSENAAHRIAVEWDEGSQRRTGVYIPRRDSSSLVNTLLGGRLFPGHHHRADFRIEEIGDRVSISMASRDDEGRVSVRGRVGDHLPSESVFTSLAEVSTFFRKDALGFSPDRGGRLEGLELETFGWSVEPLDVEDVTTSFFDDAARFPAGSVVFDNALLMRNVGHRWHARGDLYDW
jgi:hypothetical protein